MRFSPLLLTNLIVKPLRYFFSYYAGENLKYDSDEKVSRIEIGSVNDFNKIPLQIKPRILVNRGGFTYTHVGLTDNLLSAKASTDTKGLVDRSNMMLVQGQAMVIIESKNEGSVELLTDMATHFLVWSAPYICNTQGFKSFATPLGVGAPEVADEDREKFQVQITVPYLMEETWNINSDALKLNDFYFELAKSP